jgi:hypothetical protein
MCRLDPIHDSVENLIDLDRLAVGFLILVYDIVNE